MENTQCICFWMTAVIVSVAKGDSPPLMAYGAYIQGGIIWCKIPINGKIYRVFVTQYSK